MVFSRQFATPVKTRSSATGAVGARRRPAEERHRAVLAQRRAVEHQRAAALHLAGGLPFAGREVGARHPCPGLLPIPGKGLVRKDRPRLRRHRLRRYAW